MRIITLKGQSTGETEQNFGVRQDGFEAELAEIRQRQANIHNLPGKIVTRGNLH
jgi:hypothetical protein